MSESLMKTPNLFRAKGLKFTAARIVTELVDADGNAWRQTWNIDLASPLLQWQSKLESVEGPTQTQTVSISGQTLAGDQGCELEFRPRRQEGDTVDSPWQSVPTHVEGV